MTSSKAEPSKLPVFKRSYGPIEAPTEIWAINQLGYEGQPAPARHLASFIDEVASGVETIAATPEHAHRVAGLRDARKCLMVGLPHDLLRPRDVLVAAAHALSMGVELGLDIFPPGPPADARQDAEAEAWLRWQFTLAAVDRVFPLRSLIDAFDLFPLRFVSAPYLGEGEARPLDAGAVGAASTPPAGRNPTLILSPLEDWSAGDHLLLSLVGSRREPYWVVAATIASASAARADLFERLDRLAKILLDRDAHGGFLHPLGDLVWSNVAPTTTWNTAGRPVAGLAPGAASGPRRVELEPFATHEHVVDGVSLLPAAVMWLGRGALRHVIEARAAAFSECDDNRELAPGRRRLTLGDPRRGATPELVARQWALRHAMSLEPTRPPAGAAPSAEDIRQRLAAEERAQAAAAASRNPVAPTSAHAVRVGFSMRAPLNAADAAMGLRFAVKECAFDTEGLRASHPDASETRLAWTNVGAIVARQMPPDPPYERVPFLDVVPKEGPPLRILAATRVNYAALPGGAAPIAIENLRRLGRLVMTLNPSVALDAATRSFLEGKPPQAFAGLNQFTAYDGKY